MTSDSVIGSSSTVRGNIRGEGSLEILGRVEGDIELAGDLVIGENGAVQGNVTAGKISVLGAVQGDLRASQALHIESGGRVVGDLSAPRIGIANGALVRGNVQTEGEAARRPPVASPARAAAPAPRAPAPTPAARLAPPPPAEPKPVAKPALAVVEAASSGGQRRPPPPVVPALGKGAKAKKKQGRDS